ncbi:MAG: BON domain-containing protein [Gemmataceae bacterium]
MADWGAVSAAAGLVAWAAALAAPFQGIGGVTVPLPRNISYTAVLRFPTPPPATPAQVQTDVQAILQRSTMLSAPAGVQVLTDGPVIVLRGAVKDEDEARLAEGIVRLNPGVRDVRNELTYPKQ